MLNAIEKWPFNQLNQNLDEKLFVQVVRPEVRRVFERYSPVRRRPSRAGQRLSHGLLLLRHLQQEDGHRRRVLPHGGQEAALQDRLRVGKSWKR